MPFAPTALVFRLLKAADGMLLMYCTLLMFQTTDGGRALTGAELNFLDNVSCHRINMAMRGTCSDDLGKEGVQEGENLCC